MASAPGGSVPINSPPPPDILPSDPLPPDILPPDPPPPPPVAVPPPPQPFAVPPTIPSSPMPPNDTSPGVLPPEPAMPPMRNVVPPPVRLSPPRVFSPPPPDVVPPTVLSPPPPLEVLPPVESLPPPPPAEVVTTPDDVVPPPPSNDSASPPNVVSPPPLTKPPSMIPPPTTFHSPPSLNPKSPVPPSPKSTTTPVIVGAALGSVALLLAVLGLFWFLFVRKKDNRRRNPHESESHYKPGDGHNGNSAQSGYSSSGQQVSTSYVAPSPLTSSPSMSSSAGFSSGQQQLSANGTGGTWPNSYGTTEGSFLSSGTGMVLGSGTIAFTYDELKIATNGFSSVNLLGQGGFGYVHKGMLQNGKIVAVKSLKADSGQGEREFQAEVETISRVHHKHLVTLVGYCVTDKQKLLVYELVENKTMEFHLHGKGQPVMDWATRLKIAVGAAKGLAYLHEDCHPKIIHRDIKAANILLDNSFEAQVADFGLAKFTSDANTHVSTRVMGTFGYLAPEYASTGQLSEKSDVFSFGVLLLELITGRRPVNLTSRAQMEDSLVEWARPILAKALQDGNFDSLVDPRLEKNYDPAEMGLMITCAASCVRHSAKNRPRMSEIVRVLEGNKKLSDLNYGVEPGFSALYSSADLYEAPNTEDMLRFRGKA